MIGIGFGNVDVTTNVNETLQEMYTNVKQRGAQVNSATNMDNIVISLSQTGCKNISLIASTSAANNTGLMRSYTSALEKNLTKQLGSVSQGGQLSLSFDGESFTGNVTSTVSKLKQYISQKCGHTDADSNFQNIKLDSKSHKSENVCNSLTFITNNNNANGRCVLRAYQKLIQDNKTLQTGEQSKGIDVGDLVGDFLVLAGICIVGFLIYFGIKSYMHNKELKQCLDATRNNQGIPPPQCAKSMGTHAGVRVPPPRFAPSARIAAPSIQTTGAFPSTTTQPTVRRAGVPQPRRP